MKKICDYPWPPSFDSYKIGININLIAIVLSEKVVIANKSFTLNCIAKNLENSIQSMHSLIH